MDRLKHNPFQNNPQIQKMMGGGGVEQRQFPLVSHSKEAAPADQEALNPEVMAKIMANAERTNQAIMAHREFGFHKEAEDMEQRYFSQVLSLGQLDLKMAENTWNASFLANKYGPLKLKPAMKIKTLQHEGQIVSIDERTGKVVEVTDLGKHQTVGDSLFYIRDGVANQIVVGDEKAPTTKDFVVGENTETRQWDGKAGKWVKLSSGPRWKDGDGESGSGIGKGGKRNAAALDEFKSDFIRRYAALTGVTAATETGKIDLDNFMSQAGSHQVKDQVNSRTNKPMTMYELYNEGAAELERQIESGKSLQAALQQTRHYMHNLGRNDYAKANLTPDQAEAIRAGTHKAEKGSDGSVRFVPVTPAKTEAGPTVQPTAQPKPSRYQQDKERALKRDAEKAGRPRTSLYQMGTKPRSEADEVEEYIKEQQEKASPESEQKEIDARVKRMTARGVPESEARKHAEKHIRPKYAELRRLLQDYLEGN